MQIARIMRPEYLFFTAFLATLPLYAPNQILFETELLVASSFRAYFATTLLGGSFVCGLVGAVISASKGDGFFLRPWTVTGACALYILGYGVVACAAAVPGISGYASGMVAGILLALSTVILAIAWARALSVFGLRLALLWISVMVGIAAMIELLMSAVTFSVGLIVFSFLTLSSAVALCSLAWRGGLESDASQGAGAFSEEPMHEPHVGLGIDAMKARSISPGRSKALLGHISSMGSVVAEPFIGLMIFAFMMGTRRFILFDEIHMEVLGCALGALIVMPLYLLRDRRPLMPLIYRLLIPLFCLVLIVLNAFPAGSIPLWLAGWVSYIFYGAIAILALASLCAVAHGSEFSCGLIYGPAVAGFALCSLVGIFAARTELFQIEGGGPALLVVSTLYFAYLISSALLAPWLKGNRGANPDDIARDESTSLQRNVAERCEELAQENGLTPREAEILKYLGRGHGIAFVAEELVISESTVRTHVKSIYKKLGVNSREQLLEKVDA